MLDDLATSTPTVTATPTSMATPTTEPPEDHDAAQERGLARESELRGLAEAIQYWSQVYGVSAEVMTTIAQCESTFGTNPDAYDSSGPYAFDSTSGHAGAYQFAEGTWLGTPPGQRGESAYNDWYAAEGAAYYISIGERWRWPNC
jgi:hypothetical protein